MSLPRIRFGGPATQPVLAAIALLLLTLAAGCGQPAASPAPTGVATAAAPPTVQPSPPAAQADGPTATTVVARGSTAAPPQARPSLTPTATATAAAVPTATPTTTRLPSERLAQAIHLHEVGDYEAARRAYADLMRDLPEDPGAVEARWRLGLAYLEDGEPTEAMLALELARQTTPAEQLPPAVDFWLGQALAEVGLPARAAEAYGRYLAREDTLAGDINLRIGRLLMQTGEEGQAMSAFGQALALAPDNFIRFATLEELADAHAAREDWPAAVGYFDQILAESRFARYRAEIQYRAGQVLAQAGDAQSAGARYRRALAEEEASPGALNALNALLDRGEEVDLLQQGRVLLGNGYTAEGIQRIYSYFADQPDHPAGPHELVAEAYFRQRNYSAALAEWQTQLDTHPEYADPAYVLARMAVANGRLGDTGLARDLYRRAAELSTARAPTALLEEARLAERDHDCRTAAAEYLDVARLYPRAEAAGEALYRAGLCQYRLGDKEAAVDAWQRLVADYPGNTYAHPGRFWAGKAWLELGDQDTAARVWQGLRAEAPDSYYTARAEQLGQRIGGDGLEGEVTAGQEADAGLSSPASDLQAAAEAWLAGWAAPGIEDPSALRRLPEAVAADPQLARAEAYLRLGLRADAIRELDALRERYKDDPLAQYALALRFRDLGALRHATLAAVRLGALAPGGLFEAPRFVQRLAYPTYFAGLVEGEAAALGLDPLLLFALIRQESFFERGARSSAAAQGLTQVIPSTAEWIAEAIGWPDFRADDIYKPYINVKFGAYYLWAALEMFDGNPYPALVGYNAGPGNARFWLEETGSDDPDLFVEEISLAEPKLYVRRVLAHLAQYRRLYAD